MLVMKTPLWNGWPVEIALWTGWFVFCGVIGVTLVPIPPHVAVRLVATSVVLRPAMVER